MGVATFLIGLLPTYATIGMSAPVLLVVLRCLQGIGVGGEWGGAVLMAVEHSPPGRRGLSGSWPQIGCRPDCFCRRWYSAWSARGWAKRQFLAWGWRVPFLVEHRAHRRRAVHSSADPRVAGIREAAAEWARRRAAARAAVRDYGGILLLAMGMRVAENGLFYVYTVFVLSYGPAAGRLARDDVWGVTLAALVGLIGIPFFGGLSDRVGRRPVYLFGAVFSLVYALPSSGCSTRVRRRRRAGHRARPRARVTPDVRPPGRRLLGAVRRARPGTAARH